MTIDEQAVVFDALGSELRLRVVELIAAHKEMCICELVDQLEMSQANVSRHVGILRDAGILLSRKLGVLVIHRVDESRLRDATAAFSDRVAELHQESDAVDVEARLARRCAVGGTP